MRGSVKRKMQNKKLIQVALVSLLVLLFVPVMAIAANFCAIAPNVKVPCPLGTQDGPAG